MNLARNLDRVARLYRVGILDDASTVWINADLPVPAFWILSARPACILWVSAPTAGTVRLTKDRVRWAPTYNGTAKSPQFDVRLTAISVESIEHVTVVVDHGQSAAPVQVVDGVESVKPDRHSAPRVQVIDGVESVKPDGGFYRGEGAAVLDLANFVSSAYDKPPSTPSAKALAESAAFFHGTRLLTRGMKGGSKAALESDPDSYSIEIPSEMLAMWVEGVEIFDATARVLAEKIAKKIVER